MAGRWTVCFVVLACFFVYTLSFVYDRLLVDDRSRLLAQNALGAARDSVHDAIFSFFKDHQDELRGPHEQLQALLDDILRGESSLQRRRAAHTRQIDICKTLAGKRITMIGGEHVYRLHTLFLRQRERAEGKLFPCPYHEFCTHHHICLPFQDFRDHDDVPPPRYIKSPTTQELVETESAVVNYIVSDTLLSSPNESSWKYSSPFVDPMTGVRLRETYWMAAARKANVVVLGRGPLSAPGPTFSGNWSFLRQVPDYVDKSNAAADAMFSDPQPLEILNAAAHLTVSRFLPELIQLLRSVRQEVRLTRQKRLIWPGSWYRLPGRGSARSALLRPHICSGVQDVIRQMFYPKRRSQCPPEHVLVLQLSAFINAHVTNAPNLEDPWTLLFNVQVYLQNILLRNLLPRYGIVFLPLDAPWPRPSEHGRDWSHGAIDLDRERMGTIESAFLTGLDYIVGYME